jgi:hypothetical protein
MARVIRTPTKRTPPRKAVPKALGKRRLQALIEMATLDEYDESEQRVGLLTMLEDQLAVPFTTDILGASVRVERVSFSDADDIAAMCRHGRHRLQIALLNLPLPSPLPAAWEWIEAYCHWARGWRQQAPSTTLVARHLPSHPQRRSSEA